MKQVRYHNGNVTLNPINKGGGNLTKVANYQLVYTMLYNTLYNRNKKARTETLYNRNKKARAENARDNYNVDRNTFIGDSSLYARNDDRQHTRIGDGYASYATFGTSLNERNDGGGARANYEKERLANAHGSCPLRGEIPDQVRNDGDDGRDNYDRDGDSCIGDGYASSASFGTALNERNDERQDYLYTRNEKARAKTLYNTLYNFNHNTRAYDNNNLQGNCKIMLGGTQRERERERERESKLTLVLTII
jgi:hypothetical protein